MTFLCLFPLIHVLAVSFSSSWAAQADLVVLWPIGFNTESYSYVLNKPEFLRSAIITLERVGIGVPLNMILTALIAYPLSKDRKNFRMRNVYTYFFVITILFNIGLIPWYMTIKALGLLDTIWALTLYGAVPVFNVLLLMNFFRQLPKEISESAFIDGAGHYTALFKIYLPLSAPALATLTLFVTVGHWNAWFDGLILMNSPKNFPLQSYLRNIIINISSVNLTTRNVGMQNITDRTVRGAQIFLATLPIICLYPFLQRYFINGIVLGSVKG